jgi:integrase
MELPTAEQVRAVLDVADPRVRTFVALRAFAGLRLGETAGVLAGDFDLRARQLQVRRQVQRESAAGVEMRPRKYGSERTVHLADGLVVIVKSHLTRLPGKGRERWLFHGENGNPPHQNTVGATGGARPARRRATRQSSSTTSGTSTPRD